MGGVIGGDGWSSLVGNAAALDAAIAATYARRADVLRSCAWAFAAWVLGAGAVRDSLSPSALRAKEAYARMPARELESLLRYLGTLQAER